MSPMSDENQDVPSAEKIMQTLPTPNHKSILYFYIYLPPNSVSSEGNNKLFLNSIFIHEAISETY